MLSDPATQKARGLAIQASLRRRHEIKLQRKAENEHKQKERMKAALRRPKPSDPMNLGDLLAQSIPSTTIEEQTPSAFYVRSKQDSNITTCIQSSSVPSSTTWSNIAASKPRFFAETNVNQPSTRNDTTSNMPNGYLRKSNINDNTSNMLNEHLRKPNLKDKTSNQPVEQLRKPNPDDPSQFLSQTKRNLQKILKSTEQNGEKLKPKLNMQAMEASGLRIKNTKSRPVGVKSHRKLTTIKKEIYQARLAHKLNHDTSSNTTHHNAHDTQTTELEDTSPTSNEPSTPSNLDTYHASQCISHSSECIQNITTHDTITQPSQIDSMIQTVTRTSDRTVLQDTLPRVYSRDTYTGQPRLAKVYNQSITNQSTPNIECQSQTISTKSYITHAQSKELDQIIRDILAKALAFQLQQRIRLQGAKLPKTKRRIVSGLREIQRDIKTNKLKLIIIARDIEPLPGVDPLFQIVMKIIDLAESKYPKIPVIFSMRRRSLGRTLKTRTNISAVGLYSLESLDDLPKRAIELAADLKFERNKLNSGNLSNPPGDGLYLSQENTSRSMSSSQCVGSANSISTNTSISHGEHGFITTENTTSDNSQVSDSIGQQSNKDASVSYKAANSRKFISLRADAPAFLPKSNVE